MTTDLTHCHEWNTTRVQLDAEPGTPLRAAYTPAGNISGTGTLRITWGNHEIDLWRIRAPQLRAVCEELLQRLDEAEKQHAAFLAGLAESELERLRRLPGEAPQPRVSLPPDTCCWHCGRLWAECKCTHTSSDPAEADMPDAQTITCTTGGSDEPALAEGGVR